MVTRVTIGKRAGATKSIVTSFSLIMPDVNWLSLLKISPRKIQAFQLDADACAAYVNIAIRARTMINSMMYRLSLSGALPSEQFEKIGCVFLLTFPLQYNDYDLSM